MPLKWNDRRLHAAFERMNAIRAAGPCNPPDKMENYYNTRNLLAGWRMTTRLDLSLLGFSISFTSNFPALIGRHMRNTSVRTSV